MEREGGKTNFFKKKIPYFLNQGFSTIFGSEI
jgi:hypothetical protein